ncbi:uncharacterized protein LOC126834489 isoform X2 [Adelges cooleyi]|uniref:uncharacterized protein LOC126834489 isoform X2 n=1 Tax=Adelges cooleyi TaxID=133065 RepID=UPI00217FF59E|nr:uncharacterized protein LOC126834489 isoform X2 [Adelges cooleyi]
MIKVKKETRITLAKFIEAVNLGHIPRWSIPVMRREFNKIASIGKFGYQITIEDIKKYDVEKEYTSEELDDIMTDYGVSSEGERKLFFRGFIIAVNTEYFPVIDLNLRLCVLKCKGNSRQ